MSSVVAVCNQAILSLGGTPILSLNDDSVEAKTCLAVYDSTVKAMIETMNWTFATKWVELSKLSGAIVGEFANAFPLPPDCIRVIFAGSDHKNQYDDWQIEGNNLVTDSQTVKCKIVFDGGVLTYSPLFTQALIYAIASKLAVPLTSSASSMQNFFQLYTATLAKASSLDGLQGRTRRIRSHWIESARRSGYSGAGPVV